MSLSPEDAALLAEYGAVLCHDVVKLITVSAKLYSSFLFSASFAGYLILSSLTKHKSQLILLASTILAAATLTLNLRDCAFPHAENDLMVQAELASTRAFTREVISIWPNQIVLLLSDCIITWRAWVVWPGQRYVQAIIAFLAIRSFVLHPIFDTLEITETSAITIDLDFISSGVIFAMNAVITAFIGLKAWTLSSSQRILLLWVDSGVVFTIFQVNTTTDSRVLTAMVNSMAGMYPTLLLIIVNMGVSMVEDAASSQNMDTTSGSGTVAGTGTSR
ncbi:hypothetical protein BT96DRAFT_924585 [Gymnopus androsaceus JB14]|uniref:Uncharacterized protein n=1 Tax=Gymnopus androsaceus JB14 TaxID=1447944 RepID=A0A6A4H5R0_9AGAR|nr:hypothetical protein BT96DRAFT_924585 [Gymnopus androsaceus JB14]